MNDATRPQPTGNSDHEDANTSLSLPVAPADNGSRLDRFLAEKLRESGLSREKIKGLIKTGQVRVDGLTVSSPRHTLFADNRVTMAIPASRNALEAEHGDLAVLYRDAALAVIDKPAGLTVHPAPGKPSGTLAHRLVAHFPELAGLEGFRPGIVHRLDKDTSGLMLVALTEQCRLALAGQFARHEVFKEYLALVHGIPAQAQGHIDAPIGRHPERKTLMAVLPRGKSAQSSWRVLYADPRARFALVAVRIHSGRTHQVRVHMRHIGHPLWGDSLYGGNRACARSLPCPVPGRQMLHAWKLAFRHPFPDRMIETSPGVRRNEEELCFLRPPPDDFVHCLRALSRDMLRVVVTGSPGCGKSTLSALLREQGLPCFSADAEVNRLYEPGQDGHRLLRSYFDTRFVPGHDAPVDKAALGAAMMQDDALRLQVESLLHPLVWHALDMFWREQEGRGHDLAVAEIPLYLESGRRKSGPDPDGPAPLLVGVHCPYALREERLLRTRGWTKPVIERMESWQWPEDKKMQHCDLVIDNSGDREMLRAKAVTLAENLRSLRESRANRAVKTAVALWSSA